MKRNLRKIGVLTSGGDASGMNCAVRSVVRAISAFGATPVAIDMGYKGLLENHMRVMGPRDVSNIMNRGGTILYSDRCLEFATPEGLAKAVKTCQDMEMDGIITLGGDGTFRGARDLTANGISCIGVPCTIDNDITSTDYSIGYDTALNTIIAMVDRLRDTCESHARCNVVEVMGRGCGDLALYAGLAVGASAIVTKEIPFDEAELIERMLRSKAAGKRNFIVIVSENMGPTFAEELAAKIDNATKIETKFARLAHVQRGGSPTFRDRSLASQMGYKAVELLFEGKENMVVCLRHDNVSAMDINFALDLDRFHKGKMSEEEISAAYSAEEVAEMKAISAERKAEIQRIYQLNQVISI